MTRACQLCVQNDYELAPGAVFVPAAGVGPLLLFFLVQ
jgi:hypothetical protein